MNHWTVKVLPLLVAFLQLGRAAGSDIAVCPDLDQECPEIRISCPAGPEIDLETGCEKCECHTVCPDLDQECPEIRISCPAGPEIDPETGCEKCECQTVCPDPTIDCPDLQCPAGLEIDPELGCEICKCKEECPEIGPDCMTDCRFGLRVDTKGCAVCDCLPEECARRLEICDITCDRVAYSYDLRSQNCFSVANACCDRPNIYESRADCVQACMACPKLDCVLDCVLQKDADGCDQCKCQ